MSIRTALHSAWALLAAWTMPLAAQPLVYALDPQQSFVTFEVLHFDTSTLRARIGPLQGFVELDRAARRGSVSLQIDMNQVSTSMPFFDQRLRERDLLATKAYPVAYYVSSKFVFDGQQLKAVRGEITWHDVNQGLELRALRFGCYRDPQLQREVCGGDFEGHLKRSDFGIGFGLPFVANEVRLLVQVAGIRQ